MACLGRTLMRGKLREGWIVLGRSNVWTAVLCQCSVSLDYCQSPSPGHQLSLSVQQFCKVHHNVKLFAQDIRIMLLMTVQDGSVWFLGN